MEQQRERDAPRIESREGAMSHLTGVTDDEREGFDGSADLGHEGGKSVVWASRARWWHMMRKAKAKARDGSEQVGVGDEDGSGK